ncbi:MAG: helix-turn-helix domain-containing protein [Deltaproteobacteria bacterium]|nr:helix-turn-helix domain-containing protein [Deltaproteobacteria bacterium]
MESPGEYLKRERELRGIKLVKIFEATRVPMKHLEAIEADDYERMPHPTFVKGYIRSYCKVLGVDETDTVLRYEIYLREKAEAAKAVSRPSQPRSVKQPPPLPGGVWKNRRNVLMAGGAAAVIVIAIVLAFLPGTRPEPEEQAPEEQAVEQALPAPAPEAALPKAPEPVEKPAPERAREKAKEAPLPLPKEQPKAAATEDKKTPAAARPAEQGHSLVVKATETVWIQAAIDGAEPFEVLLQKGETISWKATEGFYLKIGNAGGVELAFDGKKLGPVGKTGYVVGISLPGGKVNVLSKPAPEPAVEEPPATEAKPSAQAPAPSSPSAPARPGEGTL